MAWHYRPEALADAMQHAHYPLQAALYAVALHRFLRWRLPGYDPAAHLGGVAYLFLRGHDRRPTSRSSTAQPCGVFAWQPAGDVRHRPVRRARPGRAVSAVAADHRVDLHDGRRSHRRRRPAARRSSDATVLDARRRPHRARPRPPGRRRRRRPCSLAAALAVRAVRLGHVYVDLATVADDRRPRRRGGRRRPRRAALARPGDLARRSSPPARSPRSAPTARPTDRCAWSAPASTSTATGATSGPSSPTCWPRAGGEPPAVDRDALAAGLRPALPAGARTTDGADLQRLAAATAVERRFSVVAGGPGTGKTTTVARIVALLHEQAAALGQPPPRVALAAPTGKAAARLAEAVHAEAGDHRQSTERSAPRCSPPRPRRCTACSAGSPAAAAGSVHDASNQLPHNVVIVDESSMVGLSMMAKLLAAVRPTARLVLVGDPRQLASVEAGAVLGDIVGSRAARHRRAPHGSTATAAASPRWPRPSRRGDGDAVVDGAALVARRRHLDRARADRRPRPAPRSWPSSAPGGRRRRPGGGRRRPAAATAPPRSTRCARCRCCAPTAAARPAPRCGGPRSNGGCARRSPATAASAWYAGRPLLVTENDYALGVFNGDTGVVDRRGRRPPPGRVRPPRRAALGPPDPARRPSSRSTP